MFKLSHASTILTCLGAVGTIATSVASVMATPKALALLEDAKEEKEDLTKMEIVRIAGPAYIPSIVIGVSTLACIFGANILNKQSQATLASAYALLDSSYREYKAKVKEIYGKDADIYIQTEVAKDRHKKFDEDETGEEIKEGECLFFDSAALRYFTSTFDEVIQKATIDDDLECYIISTPFDSTTSFMDI